MIKKNYRYLTQTQMSGNGCIFTIPLKEEQLNKSEIAKIIEDYLSDVYDNGENSSNWTKDFVHIRGYYTNEFSKRHLYELKLFKEWYYVAVSLYKDKDEADVCIVRDGVISQKKLLFR